MVFSSDFNGRPIQIKKSPSLVWNPDHGRTPFLELIKSAKHTLWIYQQDIQDKEIALAIADSARKGVDVRIIMSPFPFSQKEDKNIPHQNMIREAGGKVGLITHRTTHAKLTLVDVGTPLARGCLGSANFYTKSLEENRELGIIISNSEALNTMRSIFEADWKKADFTPRKEGENLH